jgi:hypothetical protein
MDCVVFPFDQLYDPPSGDADSTVPVPVHTKSFPEIDGMALGLTTTMYSFPKPGQSPT